LIVHSLYHSDIYLTVYQKNHSHPSASFSLPDFRITKLAIWENDIIKIHDALLSPLAQDQ
jgi:hypothetical protein